jgi:hypothetical protein
VRSPEGGTAQKKLFGETIALLKMEAPEVDWSTEL